MASIPTVAQAWRLPVDRTSWNTHKSLELRQVTISPPQKGEVLVKLHSAALNYRPKYMKRALGASAPGCLAQYKIFPAESLLPIPPHLSYEEASTIPCAALTAWHPFFEKQPITNESTVLVLGSGGVSVFGAQLCKAAGARVIATTSSQAKAERYKSLGVDDVVNYREFPQWSVKVKELTGGQGVEQVLEIGGQGTLVHSVRSVKPNGHVHMIGAVAGSTPSGSLAELGGAIVSTPVSGHMVGSKAMCERLDAFMTEHKIKLEGILERLSLRSSSIHML